MTTHRTGMNSSSGQKHAEVYVFSLPESREATHQLLPPGPSEPPNDRI